MLSHGAERGAGWENRNICFIQFGGKRHACHQTATGTLHITFHTGNLSGKEALLPADHLKGSVQESGTVQESVAVHYAVAGVFCMLEPGNQTEDPLLFAEFQPGLKSNQVVHCVRCVILPELNDGERLFSGSRISQPYGLHRAECGYHKSPFGHAFDGHAAFKNTVFLKAVDLRGFSIDQFVDENRVFFFCHGGVQVVVSPVITAETEKF